MLVVAMALPCRALMPCPASESPRNFFRIHAVRTRGSRRKTTAVCPPISGVRIGRRPHGGFRAPSLAGGSVAAAGGAPAGAVVRPGPVPRTVSWPDIDRSAMPLAVGVTTHMGMAVVGDAISGQHDWKSGNRRLALRQCPVRFTPHELRVDGRKATSSPGLCNCWTACCRVRARR